MLIITVNVKNLKCLHCFFRLCFAYINKDDTTINIEDIMENCCTFSKNNHIPTKQAVSKLIPHLFCVERCYIYKGQRRIGFKNLAKREDDSSMEVTLPTHCQNILCITNAINFTMPTLLLIDGEVTSCHVKIEPQTISLTKQGFHTFLHSF